MNFTSGTMRLRENQGVSFLTFPSFDALPFLNHAFSTRLGGVSTGEFSSMNLGFGRGDPEENVQENYRRFCGATGFSYESLVASAQDHHTIVRRVGEEERGIGIYRPRDRESVDGLVTDCPGIALVTYYADCVPLFFADPVKKAVGLAHAGWRGTVDRIGEVMVRTMAEEFGSDPAGLFAAVGPSIGPCCYEVDAPVADRFLALDDLRPEEFVEKRENGKYLLNLWETNRRVLLKAGLPPEHIEVAGLCTRCNSELLFSHRATGGKRGSLAAMISVRREGR